MIKRKPPTSGGLVQVKNQAELEAALNDTAQKGGGLSFDGNVDPIKIDGTLEVALRDLGEAGPKFLFNGLRVESTNTNGLINPAQPNAKPARFVIGSSDRNVVERDCYVAPYGDNPPQMSVWSSASRTTVPLKRGARPSNSMTVPPMRRRGQ
jgi:hypothetical protein